MWKYIRHVVIIVCGSIALSGYVGMRAIDVWQKISTQLNISEKADKPANSNSTDTEKVVEHYIVSSGAQFIHQLSLPDFQPVISLTNFVYSLAKPVSNYYLFTTHQVHSKALLSYFSRLYRSAILGQAP